MVKLFTHAPRFSVLHLCVAIACVVLVPQTSIAGFLDGREVIESQESLYNNIYVTRDGPYVNLTFGYNTKIYTESSYNTKDESELPLVYTQFMTAGLIYPQKITSILEIGFGGGRTSWYLHRALPDVPITSVELDPAVVKIAHKYFGTREEKNFSVVAKDGRLFLAQSKQRYDIIMIDAYRGPFIPFHLLTEEFYQIVKDHLNPGGVVVQNVEPSTMLFDSAVKTMHAVFEQIEFYPASGNIVTIAYNGPQRTAEDLSGVAAERQALLKTRYNLSDLLKARKPLSSQTTVIDSQAKVLTDDFAPVEALHAIERHNRKWENTQ